MLSLVDVPVDNPLDSVHERLHMRPIEATDFGEAKMAAVWIVYLLKYRIDQLGSEDFS